ncbi:DUF3088 family protein [Lacibacterium aquatile]|uniref:DUF3088 family protein n=1 Tax=Lacibacterium aquatile TaxID=1168082 RepID=A0ABW5DUR2_9PROT
MATLYLLKSDIIRNGEGPFFCGQCAMVEGFLGYYPQVRHALEIHYIEYPKPRPELIGLGEENQNSPALLMSGEEAGGSGKQVGDIWLLNEPKAIIAWLAAHFNVGRPLS